MEGQNYITFTLTKPALEALFENTGDEIKVCIQKAAKVQFIKERLSGMLTDGIREQLGKIIESEIGTYRYGNSEIKPQLKEAIKKHTEAAALSAKTEIEAVYTGIIREAVAEKMSYIEKTIDDRITALLNDTIRAKVAAKLKTATERLISEL